MTIAVLHSDSARGTAALHAAAQEAVWRGQPLAVLQIIPGADEPTGEDEALRASLTTKLEGFPDLSWTVHRAAEEFDTADALLDLADEVSASLLVLGAKRRTPVGKLLLGSMVQRVLLDSQIPVLVVKASS